jgi:hypothetical protein
MHLSTGSFVARAARCACLTASDVEPGSPGNILRSRMSSVRARSNAASGRRFVMF